MIAAVFLVIAGFALWMLFFIIQFAALLSLLTLALGLMMAVAVYVQVRMIATIAKMGSYDLKDYRVKALVYACLCGNAVKDIVKEMGIKIGTKLTEQATKNISRELILKINQAVGFRLITKFG